ncbi:MAG: hypothetical protein LR015_03560 [Verrucomicrobia bacterium]|nr:hypothetical protein [Verrucomicrobiota bacterium]
MRSERIEHVSESLTPGIRLFARDWSANCVAARPGGEQALSEPMVRNEGEAHLMSPDSLLPFCRGAGIMPKADRSVLEETR